MSRGKSNRSAKKRRDKRRRGLHVSLKQRTGKNFPDHKVMVGPPPDGVKMSEVLERLVGPYTEYAETENAFRELVTMAVVAWNVTLFPEKDRQSALDEALAALPLEARADSRRIVEELMERKERHFSGYRRMILDFEVVDKDDSWRLLVASSVADL